MSRSELVSLIEELAMAHSPGGREEEAEAILEPWFNRFSSQVWRDPAGNLISLIKGNGSHPRGIAITGHKDELSMIVSKIDEQGRISLRISQGPVAWVYGEGPIDLLGDHQIVTGILSFGCRHVENKNQMPDDGWAATWVETKLSPQDLAESGVHVGSKAVVGRHRKRALVLGDYVAGYALDGKVTAAILILIMEALATEKPALDTYLVATTNEEGGCFGGIYASQTLPIDAMIAVEIGPVADEYQTKNSRDPLIFYQDTSTAYDEGINRTLTEKAHELGFGVQPIVAANFGSDASRSRQSGRLARAGCVGFPTENTHGFEISHLEGIENTARLLARFLIGPDLPIGEKRAG